MTKSQSLQASMVTGLPRLLWGRSLPRPRSLMSRRGGWHLLAAAHAILPLSSVRSPCHRSPGPSVQPACQLWQQESVWPHGAECGTDLALLTRRGARNLSVASVCLQSLRFALKICKERGPPTHTLPAHPTGRQGSGAISCLLLPPTQLVLLHCARENTPCSPPVLLSG